VSCVCFVYSVGVFDVSAAEFYRGASFYLGVR